MYRSTRRTKRLLNNLRKPKENTMQHTTACPVCGKLKQGKGAITRCLNRHKKHAQEDAKETTVTTTETHDTAPLLQGVCKDCGNGTLNNDLNPAFTFEADGYVFCLNCGSTHLDIL